MHAWGMCKKHYRHKYRLDNLDKIRQQEKEYRKARPPVRKRYAQKPDNTNRERILQRRRQRRQENLDRVRQREQKWRDANRDLVRHKDRKYRASNPTKVQEWRMANPDKARRSHSARRARKANAPGILTDTEWRGLVARSHCCHWCKRKWNTQRPDGSNVGALTHDPVVPLFSGGANTLGNSVCACRRCNSSKGPRAVNPSTGLSLLL